MAENDPNFSTTQNGAITAGDAHQQRSPSVDLQKLRGELLDVFAELESQWVAVARKNNADPKFSSSFGLRIREVSASAKKGILDQKKIAKLCAKLEKLNSHRANLIHSHCSIAYDSSGDEILIFKHVPADEMVATVMGIRDFTGYVGEIKQVTNEIKQLLKPTPTAPASSSD